MHVPFFLHARKPQISVLGEPTCSHHRILYPIALFRSFFITWHHRNLCFGALVFVSFPLTERRGPRGEAQSCTSTNVIRCHIIALLRAWAVSLHRRFVNKLLESSGCMDSRAVTCRLPLAHAGARRHTQAYFLPHDPLPSCAGHMPSFILGLDE